MKARRTRLLTQATLAAALLATGCKPGEDAKTAGSDTEEYFTFDNGGKREYFWVYSPVKFTTPDGTAVDNATKKLQCWYKGEADAQGGLPQSEEALLDVFAKSPIKEKQWTLHARNGMVENAHVLVINNALANFSQEVSALSSTADAFQQQVLEAQARAQAQIQRVLGLTLKATQAIRVAQSLVNQCKSDESGCLGVALNQLRQVAIPFALRQACGGASVAARDRQQTAAIIGTFAGPLAELSKAFIPSTDAKALEIASALANGANNVTSQCLTALGAAGGTQAAPSASLAAVSGPAASDAGSAMNLAEGPVVVDAGTNAQVQGGIDTTKAVGLSRDQKRLFVNILRNVPSTSYPCPKPADAVAAYRQSKGN